MLIPIVRDPVTRRWKTALSVDVVTDVYDERYSIDTDVPPSHPSHVELNEGWACVRLLRDTGITLADVNALMTQELRNFVATNPVYVAFCNDRFFLLFRGTSKQLEQSFVFYPDIQYEDTPFLPAYKDEDTSTIYIQTNQHACVSYAWRAQEDKSGCVGTLHADRIVNSNGQDVALLVGSLRTYHWYYGFFKPSVNETIPQLIKDGRFNCGAKFLFVTEFVAQLTGNLQVGLTHVYGFIDA